jgi:hypothetical protein
MVGAQRRNGARSEFSELGYRPFRTVSFDRCHCYAQGSEALLVADLFGCFKVSSAQHAYPPLATTITRYDRFAISQSPHRDEMVAIKIIHHWTAHIINKDLRRTSCSAL